MRRRAEENAEVEGTETTPVSTIAEQARKEAETQREEEELRALIQRAYPGTRPRIQAPVVPPPVQSIETRHERPRPALPYEHRRAIETRHERPRPTLPEEHRRAVESIIGYTFKNADWLWEALQQRGSEVQKVGSRDVKEGNLALALRGDAALDLAVVTAGTKENSCRRDITNQKIDRLCNDNLDKIGLRHGLDKYLHYFANNKGVNRKHLMADAVEAIIGVVCEDSDNELEDVKRVMKALGI
ncbi:hypothetical protein K402DRAFT_404897 [Aulographum hederae CBS 113979]|uniref:RNase III domain-containing protein n=1 Tax=Aulographum hederae CBS 113979 TaxID=1176131 RepID=A0A6G1GYE2_9PEZI|nr:hypothetical protein K402DRAFT_404897 [Aulographum hederae CBS 113979]